MEASESSKWIKIILWSHSSCASRMEMLINVYRGKENANDIDDIKLRISSKVYEKCLNVKHNIRFLFPKNYAYFHLWKQSDHFCILLDNLIICCESQSTNLCYNIGTGDGQNDPLVIFKFTPELLLVRVHFVNFSFYPLNVS